MKRRVLLIFLAVLTASLFYYRDWVVYGWGQLSGQVDVLWSAKPIDECLVNPRFSEEEKEKMKMILDVRAYATDVLGLRPSGSYTKVYDQGDEPILWVVEAAEAFRLKPYKWSYPFLGELAYKGFFDLDKANREADRMRALGYDVSVGEVGAWSTLGWFDDPILSSMLKRTKPRLAELIIHELTHGTVYIKSDDELNENLATLIGRYGAEMYMRDRFPEDTSMVVDYLDGIEKRHVGREYMMGATTDLSLFYDSLSKSEISVDLKRERKEERIESLLLGLEERTGFRPDGEVNNTFFTGYMQYNGALDSLQVVFENDFGGDVRLFIDHFSNLEGNTSK